METMKRFLVSLLCTSLLIGSIPDSVYARENIGLGNNIILDLETISEDGMISENEPVADDNSVTDDAPANDDGVVSDNNIISNHNTVSESDILSENRTISGNTPNIESSGTYTGSLDLLIEGKFGMEMFQPGSTDSYGTIQSFSTSHVSDRLYQGILETMEGGKITLDISSYHLKQNEDTLNMLKVLIQSAINNTPRFFYFDNAWSYECRDGNIISVSWQYRDAYMSSNHELDKELLSRAMSSYDKGVKVMMSDIKAGMSDVEKVFAIHEKMVEEIDYDMINYTKGTIPYDDYTAYGIFTNRCGVCSGYAAAFKELMDKIDVSCQIVTSNDVNHAWNLVKLNNKWYHVDVTWDDPYSVDDTNYNCNHSHEYIFLSDNEMMNDHGRDWYDSNNYPRAKEVGFTDYLFRTYREGYIPCMDQGDGSGQKWYVITYSYDNNSYHEVCKSAQIDGNDVSQFALSRPESSDYGEVIEGFCYQNTIYMYGEKKVYQYDMDGTLKDTLVDISSLGDEAAIYGLSIKNDKIVYCYSDEVDGKRKYYRKPLPIYVQSMNFAETEKTLFEDNETFTMSLTTIPTNHTDTITYSSSMPDVAAIDAKTGKVTAKKSGTAIITATSIKGVTAQYQVTCQIAEATTLSVDRKGPLTGKEGAFVDISWKSTTNTNHYYIYRSSSTESMKLLAQIKESEGIYTYHDEVEQQDNYIYYIRSYQEIGGKLYRGSLSAPLRVGLLYATAMEFYHLQEEVLISDTFLISANLIPDNPSFSYDIQYTSSDESIIAINPSTGNASALNTGETIIRATAFHDGNAMFSTSQSVKVVKQNDENSLITGDIYALTDLVTTLSDVPLPNSVAANYEWKYPNTKLNRYSGETVSFACIRKKDTNASYAVYRELSVPVHVSKLSGFTVDVLQNNVPVSSNILFLEDASGNTDKDTKLRMEVLPEFAGDTSSDMDIKYEYTFKETTKKGLVISAEQGTGDKGVCQLSIDSDTKTGTATIKLTAKAVQKSTGKQIKTITKNINIMVLQTRASIVLYDESWQQTYDKAALEARINNMKIGDKLIIAGEVLDADSMNTGVKFSSGDKSVINIKLLKTNKAEISVVGYGSTTLTISSKKNEKSIPSVNISCIIQNNTPKISTQKLTLDKNKTAKAEFQIYESYGRTVSTNSIAIQKIVYNKKDVTSQYKKLFVLNQSDEHYQLGMSQNISHKEAIDGLQTGNYVFTLTGRWLTKEGLSVSENSQLTPQQEIGEINLKLTETKPAITMKQTKKMNLFYMGFDQNGNYTRINSAAAGIVDIYAKGSSIADVRCMTSAYSCSSNAILPSDKVQISVELMAGVKKKNIPKRFDCIITCNGYRPLTVSCKFGTETKTPSLKYRKSNLTLNRYAYPAQNETIIMDLSNTAREIGTLRLPTKNITAGNKKATTALKQNWFIFEYSSTETGGSLHVYMNSAATVGTYKFKVTPVINKNPGESWNLPSKMVTIQVVDKKPIVKLEKKNLVLNPYIYSTCVVSENVALTGMTGATLTQISFQPYNKNAKRAGNQINLAYHPESSSITAKIVSVTDDEGDVVVKDGDYTYQLTPTVAKTVSSQSITDTLAPVKLTIKVKNSIPKINFDKKSITLNSAVYRYEKAIIQATCTGVEGAKISYYWVSPINTAAKKNKAAFLFSYSAFDDTFMAALNKQIPKGNYTFKVTPVVERSYEGHTVYQSFAAKNITVKVVDSAPAIQMKIKGTADLLCRESSSVNCIPKIINKTGKITDVSLTGTDAAKFVLTNMHSSTGAVTLNIKQDAIMKAPGKYNLALVYAVTTNKGTLNITSKPFTVTTKQSKPKLISSANNNRLCFFQSAEDAVTQQVTLTVVKPKGATIQQINPVKLPSGIEAVNCEITSDINQRSKAVITFKLKDASKVKAGKIYTMQMNVIMEGAGMGSKPITIPAEVEIKK